MRPWYCGVGRIEADMLSGSLERPRKEGGTWMEVALAVLPMATESSGVDGRRLAAALIAGGGNASRRRSVWGTRSKCIHILKTGMQPRMQLRLYLQCQQQLMNSCRATAEAQSSVTFSFTFSSDIGLSLTIFLRNLIVSNPPNDQQSSRNSRQLDRVSASGSVGGSRG